MTDITYEHKNILQNEKADILNKFVDDYYNNLQCNHDEFIDDGYYKINNGDFFLTTREQAHFRAMTCPICNKQIYLLKTYINDWDKMYKHNSVKIKQKIKCKNM